MAEIFICYRRNDSEGYAGRLHDPLLDHFGKRAVFIDVDNLHPGVDFEQVIQNTLARSKVVLVVIGPRWLDPRLKNESDYVRREILAALKSKKRLIPVLVGGARMPAREKLPPEMVALAGKNATTLHHPTWRRDVERLIASLDRILARTRSGMNKSVPRKKEKSPTPRKSAEGAKPAAPRKSAAGGKPARPGKAVQGAKPAPAEKAAEGRKRAVARKTLDGGKTDATPGRRPSRKPVATADGALPATDSAGERKAGNPTGKLRSRKAGGALQAGSPPAKRSGARKKGEAEERRAPPASRRAGVSRTSQTGTKRGGRP